LSSRYYPSSPPEFIREHFSVTAHLAVVAYPVIVQVIETVPTIFTLTTFTALGGLMCLVGLPVQSTGKLLVVVIVPIPEQTRPNV
jgi:hypothetical protein